MTPKCGRSLPLARPHVNIYELRILIVSCPLLYEVLQKPGKVDSVCLTTLLSDFSTIRSRGKMRNLEIQIGNSGFVCALHVYAPGVVKERLSLASIFIY